MSNVQFHPRRLARKMAKRQLDKAGVTGYNKEQVGINGKKMKSAFARNWKKVAAETISRPVKKKKGRK